MKTHHLDIRFYENSELVEFGIYHLLDTDTFNTHLDRWLSQSLYRTDAGLVMLLNSFSGRVAWTEAQFAAVREDRFDYPLSQRQYFDPETAKNRVFSYFDSLGIDSDPVQRQQYISSFWEDNGGIANEPFGYRYFMARDNSEELLRYIKEDF